MRWLETAFWAGIPYALSGDRISLTNTSIYNSDDNQHYYLSILLHNNDSMQAQNGRTKNMLKAKNSVELN